MNTDTQAQFLFSEKSHRFDYIETPFTTQKRFYSVHNTKYNSELLPRRLYQGANFLSLFEENPFSMLAAHCSHLLPPNTSHLFLYVLAVVHFLFVFVFCLLFTGSAKKNY